MLALCTPSWGCAEHGHDSGYECYCVLHAYGAAGPL